MKKLICLILSVMMVLSTSAIAFASELDTKIIDADTELSKIFANYCGEKFNENYFFISEFYGDEWDFETYPQGAVLSLHISTKSSEEMKLNVARLSADNKTAKKIADVTVSSSNDYDSFQANEEYLGFLGDYFMVDSDYKVRIGVALENSTELKNDAIVSVELKATPIENNNLVTDKIVSLGVIEHPFYTPVTFDDKNLEAFGTLLTKLKFGRTVTADEVALALDGAANSVDDDSITALSEALEAEYVNIADLANTLNGKSNVTVIDTTFDGLTVSMPYAGLAGSVGEDTKVYAPIVYEGTLPAEKDRESGKEYYALDISLGVNGKPMTTEPIIPQKVVVDLPSTFDRSVKSISVLHGDDTLTATVADGKAEFMVKSFSNFVLVGTALNYTEDTATHAQFAELIIEQDENKDNVFKLELKPIGSGKIINYATGGFRVSVNEYESNASEEDVIKNFTYDLQAANGIVITNPETVTPDTDKGEIQAFTFVASAKDRENLIDADGNLPIATLVINGVGDLKIATSGLENENADINNKFYMEKFTDNDSVKATVNPSEKIATIKQEKFGINLNVDFNLNLQEDEVGTYKNNAEYINIAIELKNEITGDIHTVKLGNGTNTDAVTYLPVTYSKEYSVAKTDEDSKIMLPAYATYSYKITGLGYRTFRGSVYLDEDKTINLWNNALTSKTVNVVADDDSTAKKVTFLVGDIYEDGIVDIYDLSAVTSYFGSTNIDAANENVFACDLDRDGQISVQDIAWVQMSYGN